MTQKTDKQIINLLNRKFPGINAVSTEEFDDRTGGVWFRNSEGFDINDMPMMNMYGDADTYICGTHKTLEEYLNQYGWHSEAYDAGTLMAYS